MGRVQNLIEEARELGVSNFVFRVGWELKRRSGWLERTAPAAPDLSQARAFGKGGLLDRRLFTKAPEMMDVLSAPSRPSDGHSMRAEADEAALGRILAFSSRVLDYGSPLDWHLHPVTGRRTSPHAHWSRIEARDEEGGDIKFILEAGRFPHAYRIATAAPRFPDRAESWAAAVCDQVEDFRAKNPFGKGAHWFSSQEVALRLLAWIFAHDAFTGMGIAIPRLRSAILESAMEAGAHILEHFEYSRRSTYNNHLLAEALGLLTVGALVPGWAQAERCRALGLATLVEQCPAQFYEDGSYILNSHNYHRGAVQLLLVADRLCVALGQSTPLALISALQRSFDFLYAHQNPVDGALPNYGPNDGSLPMILSPCAFPDFRPTLQAASLRCFGERAYASGAWDEEAAWLLGAESLKAPERKRRRESVVFRQTGYLVMRGKREDDFGCLRCGDIPSRFSQIDMLHFDLWWRGQNVLVDGGSYLYNGDPVWHRHFHRTASHNTIEVDGADQMLHYRPFKNLYWTKARVRGFESRDNSVVFDGEHEGYRRLFADVTHRRQVLTDRDGAWLVRDQVSGSGAHRIRLHWLIGPFPSTLSASEHLVRVETPRGALLLRVSGMPDGFSMSMVKGQQDPPRGFLARTYGERVETPSLVVEGSVSLPLTLDTWIVPVDSAERSLAALRALATAPA